MLGVFTALDPVENGNRYQYIGANPTNWTDPSGLQGGDEHCWYGCFTDPCYYLGTGSCTGNSPQDNGGFLNGIFFDCLAACRNYYAENWYHSEETEQVVAAGVAVAFANPAPGPEDVIVFLTLMTYLTFYSSTGPSPVMQGYETTWPDTSQPVPPSLPDLSEWGKLPWDWLANQCGDALEKLIERIIPRLRWRTKHRNNDDENREKHIALGLLVDPRLRERPLLQPFINNLNETLENAEVHGYRTWQSAGLTTVIGDLSYAENFSPAFNEATAISDRIHFNLEGIQNPINFANNEGNRGQFLDPTKDSDVYWTAVELWIIKENSTLCAKTDFYRSGSVLPEPDSGLKSTICGNSSG